MVSALEQSILDLTCHRCHLLLELFCSFVQYAVAMVVASDHGKHGCNVVQVHSVCTCFLHCVSRLLLSKIYILPVDLLNVCTHQLTMPPGVLVIENAVVLNIAFTSRSSRFSLTSCDAVRGRASPWTRTRLAVSKWLSWPVISRPIHVSL